MHQHKVLIIGSGAAGLTLALNLAEHCDVAVLSKTSLSEGSSLYAQGGVAAVLDENDSIASHVADTIKVGQGLCLPNVVEYVVKNARFALEWLVSIGVQFTKKTLDDGSETYHLTREGGHQHRRVWHAADATGKAVKGTLDSRATAHSNIHIYEHHTAVDLILQKKRCVGAYVLNEVAAKVETFLADFVILATGGASRCYLYSTNPDVSSGDGIAMAHRAGCRVANMEFNQFHPTCLYHPTVNNFLISEVLRGEGALLRLPTGERFMDEYHEQAELAPRDTVARAIDDQMKRHGFSFVHLDITHKDKDFIKKTFPTIYERCKTLDLDITKDKIPVVPAAHYTCGGVMTNLNGETDIKSLYAIGEVAYTGLHGANRMASNSLLECIVFARSASDDILAKLSVSNVQAKAVKPWDESLVMESDEQVVVQNNWEELRYVMWNYVGIVRTNRRLQRAASRIALLKQEVKEYYEHFNVTKDFLELRNLVTVADLIIQSALQRKESRGLHYNLDHPETDHRFNGVTTIV